MFRILLCCGLVFSSNLFARDLEAVLDWQRQVTLGTLVDGMVTRVSVVPGQQVERGSLLVELDQREIQARLAWADARSASLKLQQHEARRELDRSLELYDRTLLSDHERKQAEIDAAKADALFLKAEAELAQIRLEREYSRIKAPFSGVITAVNIQPGQAVVNHLQSMPLLTLVEDGQMKAVAKIDVDSAQKLKPGDAAKVGVRGEWLPGEIQMIGLDPIGTETGAVSYPVEVRVTVPEGMRLHAGEQAMVRISE